MIKYWINKFECSKLSGILIRVVVVTHQIFKLRQTNKIIAYLRKLSFNGNRNPRIDFPDDARLPFYCGSLRFSRYLFRSLRAIYVKPRNWARTGVQRIFFLYPYSLVKIMYTKHFVSANFINVQSINARNKIGARSIFKFVKII